MTSPKWAKLMEFTAPGVPIERATLSEALVDLYAEDEDDVLSPSEMAMACEILGRLYPKIESEVRRRLAESLAGRPDVPHDLIAMLANDKIEIARPVVVFSPALNDDDLSHIVSSQGHAHRLAICERPEVSVRISDLLLTFDDDGICLALVRNPGAAFSEKGAEQVLERAKECEMLRLPLASRRVLPERLVSVMVHWADDAIRSALANAYGDDLPNDVKDALRLNIREVRREAELKQSEAIEAFLSSGIEHLVAAIRGGDSERIESEACHLARLPDRVIRQLLYDQDGGGLAVLCRAYGASSTLFKELYSRLNSLIPFGCTQPCGLFSAATEFFKGLQEEQARTLLNAWRKNPDRLQGFHPHRFRPRGDSATLPPPF